MSKRSVAIGVVLVAVVIAATFFVYRIIPRLVTPQPSMSLEDLSTTSGESAVNTGVVASDNTVVAEIDGALQVVTLPDGTFRDRATLQTASIDIAPDTYRGVDPSALEPGDSRVWSAQRTNGLVFGNVVSEDGRDVAPVYACDTRDKTCEEANIAYPLGRSGERPVVPSGAISPSGERVVMVVHHDVPYVTTGTRWDLVIFERGTLSHPMVTVDISAAIGQDQQVGYDSVSAVAWHSDEQQIAVATAQRIVKVDIASGAVMLLYEVAFSPDDEEGPVWDNGVLAWTKSGRYIAFASATGEEHAGVVDADEEAMDQLQYIDLERGNVIATAVRGNSVRLIDEGE